MKRIKVQVIGIAVIFLSLSAAYAQMPPSEEEDSDAKSGGRIFEELNLTEEQQKKLEENQTVQRQKRKQSTIAMKQEQAKFQEALKNPKVTRAKVEPIVKEIKKIQTRLIDDRVDGIFAVKQILTPKQFSEFQGMTQRHRKGVRARFRNWWHGRSGRRKMMRGKN